VTQTTAIVVTFEGDDTGTAKRDAPIQPHLRSLGDRYSEAHPSSDFDCPKNGDEYQWKTRIIV
jgi:hypothetical protein